MNWKSAFLVASVLMATLPSAAKPVQAASPGVDDQWAGTIAVTMQASEQNPQDSFEASCHFTRSFQSRTGTIGGSYNAQRKLITPSGTITTVDKGQITNTTVASTVSPVNVQVVTHPNFGNADYTILAMAPGIPGTEDMESTDANGNALPTNQPTLLTFTCPASATQFRPTFPATPPHVDVSTPQVEIQGRVNGDGLTLSGSVSGSMVDPSHNNQQVGTVTVTWDLGDITACSLPGAQSGSSTTQAFPIGAAAPEMTADAPGTAHAPLLAVQPQRRAASAFSTFCRKFGKALKKILPTGGHIHLTNHGIEAALNYKDFEISYAADWKATQKKDNTAPVISSPSQKVQITIDEVAAGSSTPAATAGQALQTVGQQASGSTLTSSRPFSAGPLTGVIDTYTVKGSADTWIVVVLGNGQHQVVMVLDSKPGTPPQELIQAGAAIASVTLAR